MASARVGPAHQSNETLAFCGGVVSDVRSHDVTALLIEWTRGDSAAIDKLLPLVHGELRRLARRQMAGERPNHVLQATALVNEVYLKFIDIRRVQSQDRAHFFAMAARLMRRVLVDFARNRDAGLELRQGLAAARADANRGAEPMTVDAEFLLLKPKAP
jgi:RNA polymerase sigma factor (TIGR02999 family)